MTVHVTDDGGKYTQCIECGVGRNGREDVDKIAMTKFSFGGTRHSNMTMTFHLCMNCVNEMGIDMKNIMVRQVEEGQQ